METYSFFVSFFLHYLVVFISQVIYLTSTPSFPFIVTAQFYFFYSLQLTVFLKHTLLFYLLPIRLAFSSLPPVCFTVPLLNELLTPILYPSNLSNTFAVWGQIVNRVLVMSLQTQLLRAFFPPGWMAAKSVRSKTLSQQKNNNRLRCFPQACQSSNYLFIENRRTNIIREEMSTDKGQDGEDASIFCPAKTTPSMSFSDIDADFMLIAQKLFQLKQSTSHQSIILVQNEGQLPSRMTINLTEHLQNTIR